MFHLAWESLRITTGRSRKKHWGALLIDFPLKTQSVYKSKTYNVLYLLPSFSLRLEIKTEKCIQCFYQRRQEEGIFSFYSLRKNNILKHKQSNYSDFSTHERTQPPGLGRVVWRPLQCWDMFLQRLQILNTEPGTPFAFVSQLRGHSLGAAAKPDVCVGGFVNRDTVSYQWLRECPYCMARRRVRRFSSTSVSQESDQGIDLTCAL